MRHHNVYVSRKSQNMDDRKVDEGNKQSFSASLAYNAFLILFDSNAWKHTVTSFIKCLQLY